MLPDELWIDLLVYVDDNDLANMSLVNQNGYQLYKERDLWYKKIQKIDQRLVMQPFSDCKWLYHKFILGDKQCILSYAKEHRYYSLYAYTYMVLHPLVDHDYFKTQIVKQKEKLKPIMSTLMQYIKKLNDQEKQLVKKLEDLHSNPYVYNSMLICDATQLIEQINNTET